MKRSWSEIHHRALALLAPRGRIALPLGSERWPTGTQLPKPVYIPITLELTENLGDCSRQASEGSPVDQHCSTGLSLKHRRQGPYGLLLV